MKTLRQVRRSRTATAAQLEATMPKTNNANEIIPEMMSLSVTTRKQNLTQEHLAATMMTLSPC